VKIYFTYGEETKDDFQSWIADLTHDITTESIEEIYGVGVLEKVKSLPGFIEECYRMLKPGAKAVFSSAYYAHINAWASPLNIRGISEASLNFASKDWREQSKYSELSILCNFDVAVSFAVEESVSHRAEDVRLFWMQRYLNVVQAVVFTLTKK